MRLPGCQGRATNVSHRLPRSAGGSMSPANLLDACGSGTTGCHGRTERDRLEAYADGRLLPRGSDPEQVPVRLNHPVYGPAWWLLLPCGGLVWQDRPYTDDGTRPPDA